jgi:hypothetical protein
MGSIAALVFLLFGQAPPPPATPPRTSSAPVGVALVRGDRTLQPLAQLEGEVWSDLPAGAAAGPWSLWLLDDPIVKTSPFTPRTARAITAAPRTSARSGCFAVGGLAPDAAPGVAATAALDAAHRRDHRHSFSTSSGRACCGPTSCRRFTAA